MRVDRLSPPGLLTFGERARRPEGPCARGECVSDLLTRAPPPRLKPRARTRPAPSQVCRRLLWSDAGTRSNYPLQGNIFNQINYKIN